MLITDCTWQRHCYLHAFNSTQKWTALLEREMGLTTATNAGNRPFYYTQSNSQSIVKRGRKICSLSEPSYPLICTISLFTPCHEVSKYLVAMWWPSKSMNIEAWTWEPVQKHLLPRIKLTISIFLIYRWYDHGRRGQIESLVAVYCVTFLSLVVVFMLGHNISAKKKGKYNTHDFGYGSRWESKTRKKKKKKKKKDLMYETSYCL
jgi:hypothetical protein